MAAAALSIPLSRMASSQGSIAIKEHQRAKRRPSHNSTSVSPPNISFMLATNARFPLPPTTLVAQSAPVAALSIGATRPLDPTFVAATISTTPSGVPSAIAPNGDVPVAGAMAAASESTKEQGKARAWLNKIIPEKLVHYDPSKDPRLLAL